MTLVKAVICNNVSVEEKAEAWSAAGSPDFDFGPSEPQEEAKAANDLEVNGVLIYVQTFVVIGKQYIHHQRNCNSREYTLGLSSRFIS